MMHKIFFYAIHSKINNSIILQNDSIIDSNTKLCLYKIPFGVSEPYLYFKLEFSHYQYDDIYFTGLSRSRRLASEKVYHLNLYVNLKSQPFFHEITRMQLAKYLSLIQINNIKRKKEYRQDNFDPQNRVTHMSKWNQIRLGDCSYFDIVRKKFIKKPDSIKAKSKGGIIESNNVKAIINRLKIQNTLVIAPANMFNMWEGFDIISHDQLIKDQIPNNLLKVYDQIIIHECYSQLICHIKFLLKRVTYRCVWVVNGLPLKYYFSLKNGKISISDMASYINIWFQFNLVQKKMYRFDIIKFILNDLDRIYSTYHFDSICGKKYISNAIEENIHYHLFGYYYSFASSQKMISKKLLKKKETELYKILFKLLSSIQKHSNINQYFAKKISNSLDILSREESRIAFKIRTYSKMLNYSHKLSILNNSLMEIKNDISAMKRYTGNDYTRYEKECCVCYSSDDISILVCGHTLCIACAIRIVATSSKCPLCKQSFNFDRICILGDNAEGLMDYISHVEPRTIVISPYQTNNLPVSSLQLAKYCDNVNKIILIDEAYNLAGYFNQLNHQPMVEHISLKKLKK